MDNLASWIDVDEQFSLDKDKKSGHGSPELAAVAYKDFILFIINPLISNLNSFELTDFKYLTSNVDFIRSFYNKIVNYMRENNKTEYHADPKEIQDIKTAFETIYKALFKKDFKWDLLHGLRSHSLNKSQWEIS